MDRLQSMFCMFRVNVGGQPLGVVDPIGTDFIGVSGTGGVGSVTVTTT